MSNIYVDNILIGAKSSKQTFDIYQEAKAIMKRQIRLDADMDTII